MVSGLERGALVFEAKGMSGVNGSAYVGVRQSLSTEKGVGSKWMALTNSNLEVRKHPSRALPIEAAVLAVAAELLQEELEEFAVLTGLVEFEGGFLGLGPSPGKEGFGVGDDDRHQASLQGVAVQEGLKDARVLREDVFDLLGCDVFA